MPNPRENAINTLTELTMPGHDDRVRLDAARELLYLHNFDAPINQAGPPEQTTRDKTPAERAAEWAEEMIRRWASK